MLSKHSLMSMQGLLCMQAGLDSLGAVDLRNAISVKFAVDLPATAAFDHPTSSALAQIISSKLKPSSPTLASAPPRDQISSGYAFAASRGSRRTAAIARRQIPRHHMPPAETASSAASSGQAAEAMQALVARVISDVLGPSVDVQQPLMEVKSHARCISICCCILP